MNVFRTAALFSAIALTATLALGTTSAPAAGETSQLATSVSPPETDRFGAAFKLEGVWDVQITIKDCNTGAVLLQARGQNMAIRGGSFIATTGGAMTTQGPGLGQWRYVPPGLNYATVHRHMMFDPATGTPTGFQIVERNVAMASDGNSSTANTVFDLYDMSGALLSSGCASDVSTRVFD